MKSARCVPIYAERRDCRTWRKAVQAINVPVSVGGMDVAPGEIIHMDENGAVKFPAKLEAVLNNARALQKEEAARMQALQQATSAAEIRAIIAGHAYTATDPRQQ